MPSDFLRFASFNPTHSLCLLFPSSSLFRWLFWLPLNTVSVNFWSHILPDGVPLDRCQLPFKLSDVSSHRVDALLVNTFGLEQLFQLSIFHIAEDRRVDPVGLWPEIVVRANHQVKGFYTNNKLEENDRLVYTYRRSKCKAPFHSNRRSRRCP